MNQTTKIALKRITPVALILAVLLTIYFTGLYRYFSYEQMERDSEKLQAIVESHPFLSPLLYIAAYFLVVTLLIPLSPYFSILGGFLFPQPWCSLYSLIATTAGCILTFLIARTTWGSTIRERSNTLFERMRRGFREDATSYLLAIRLSSILPFWVQNIGPALFKIPFRTYLWTTIIGLIPSRFVYTQAGRGLEELFASGEPISLSTILNPQMQIALIALALFATIPILYRQIRKRQRRRSTSRD